MQRTFCLLLFFGPAKAWQLTATTQILPFYDSDERYLKIPGTETVQTNDFKIYKVWISTDCRPYCPWKTRIWCRAVPEDNKRRCRRGLVRKGSAKINLLLRQIEKNGSSW